ncbi:Hypothetical protein PHPALM_13837 [Phytophthora palmivora]|uniref:Uncharacterized protein n=1 Tax=Phytophthora palmivora TaxID=4796 RepID=A0A2P4XWA2_9STRA|nr:Hypothetical protein PHPALM_13837 [Phytophthora palmivora]
MGLDELKPGSTKRAKNTAISVFKVFVKSEHVEFDYVKQCIEEDVTASDLYLLRKQNLSVDAAEVFFVRFIRMKTSEEQGLSLFPDADFVTCPLHAIAMALITQTAPSIALIDNLPEVPVAAALNLAPPTPLLEVLNHPDEIACLEAADTPVVVGRVPVKTTPTIYTHVNRLLDRVSSAAGVADALTSHSFRRGGAQHVNGCDGRTQHWIFDRGAWNMSTTNKSFNYIFNTSRENHKVSKALSGYDTQTKVKALSLKLFDKEPQEKIAGCQRFLFATCFKMKCSKYNLSQQVVDVLTAYLIMHYPFMKDLQAEGWVFVGASQEQAITSTNKPSEESKIINRQRSVIDQLMEHIKRQDERMDNLEAKIDGTTSDNKSKKRQQEPSQQQDKPKRRGSVAHLHTTWFAWYAQEPRWFAGAPKRERSNAKQLAALMKLFVADDLKLDPGAGDYHDRVLELGKKAEAAVLAFLSDRAIKSRGSTAVRKHLQDLYASGSLNDLVAKHIRLSQSAAFSDPDRQDPLDPAPVKTT